MVGQAPVFVKRKTEIFRMFLGLPKLVIGGGFMEFWERVRSPFFNKSRGRLYGEPSIIVVSHVNTNQV
ncbi:hypothetical protein APPUASWS_001075 [Arthrospira platensis str. Paraca]|nr:hypothetical protein APPUASWS_001075 [Arthrospira platensis str. Paraca]